jgi:hypothetical protein
MCFVGHKCEQKRKRHPKCERRSANKQLKVKPTYLKILAPNSHRRDQSLSTNRHVEGGHGEAQPPPPSTWCLLVNPQGGCMRICKEYASKPTFCTTINRGGEFLLSHTPQGISSLSLPRCKSSID